MLGLDLWNLVLDGILKLDLLDNYFLDTHTDDVTAVIVAQRQEIAKILLSRVIRTMSQWMEEHGLQLIGERTEIVIIARRQIPVVVANNQILVT